MCCAYQNEGVEVHEKSNHTAIILCTLLCIGLGNQSDEEAKPTPAPTFTPPQFKVCEVPMPEIEIPETEVEVEVIITTPTPAPALVPVEAPTPIQVSTPTPESTPTPVPTPAPTSAPMLESAPATQRPMQKGDMVYVPGFGWLESQGEGTVIHAENMYENGNKVGIMD